MPKHETQTSQQQSTIGSQPDKIAADHEHAFDDSKVDYEHPYKNAEAIAKGSFLFDFIRQLRIGADLLRVSMPAHILEQRSFLEKLTDFNSHPFLLTEVQIAKTEEERFLNACRWYLSGWHRLPKVGVKKPYNPILGETFSCSWEHQDDSKTSYFAEQVSHHPPVSAFYIENKKHSITVSGCAKPTASFRGQTATMNLEGEAVVHLHQRNESYCMTFPDVLVRGIIWGTMCVDTVGNTTLFCEQTGFSASFEFTKKKEVNGTIFKNGEALYKLSGDIHGLIKISALGKKKSKQDFVDVKSLASTFKTVKPTALQQPNESRLVWFPVTMALESKNYDKASLEKAAIENQERELRRRNEAEGKVREPIHFTFDTDQDRWVVRPETL